MLPLALTATLWLTLALLGSLLLSNFAYTALDRLTGPLLGSQRRCHDDTLSPALIWNLPIFITAMCTGTPFGIEILRIGFSYAVFPVLGMLSARSIDLALQNDVTKPSMSESWKVS